MCGDLQEEGLSGLEVAESLKEELLAREDSGAGEWQPAVARKMKVVLFRSGQAAYLGLGPYRLEKGGEIVVSREHRVAVLLRKAEGEEKRHRILGPCVRDNEPGTSELWREARQKILS